MNDKYLAMVCKVAELWPTMKEDPSTLVLFVFEYDKDRIGTYEEIEDLGVRFNIVYSSTKLHSQYPIRGPVLSPLLYPEDHTWYGTQQEAVSALQEELTEKVHRAQLFEWKPNQLPIL